MTRREESSGERSKIRTAKYSWKRNKSLTRGKLLKEKRAVTPATTEPHAKIEASRGDSVEEYDRFW